MCRHLHGDPLRRPAERPQERHDEVGDQLVLARVLAEGLAVLEQRHEIGGLGDDALQGVGHIVERRLLGGQLRAAAPSASVSAAT